MTESIASAHTSDLHRTEPNVILTPDVLIVGAGPSGLRAAAELAPTVAGEVIVLERESVAGGIPRHSDHLGYGLRDLNTFIRGPHYARVLRDKAAAAGATIMTNAMATDWAGPCSLNVTTPEGLLRVDARAIVLATGARERPRPARMIPGDRSRGVYTTGHLQNVVHLKHGKVGTRAVVVGSELVSWSAVLTLRHAGCRTVLMTTLYPQSDSYWAFNRLGRLAFRTKVATRTRVTRIFGRPNVTGVEIENLVNGKRRTIDCDTVILTGDWIPDNELARAAGIAIDPHTMGPRTDTALRTDAPGVFAIGNLLHPVDTADIAALDGAAVADHVRHHLAGQTAPAPGVELRAGAPFRWVTPSVIRPGDPAPPRDRLLLWTDTFVRSPHVILIQDGKTIAERRVWWPAAPGRVFRVPADILTSIDPTGGPVTLQIRQPT